MTRDRESEDYEVVWCGARGHYLCVSLPAITDWHDREPGANAHLSGEQVHHEHIPAILNAEALAVLTPTWQTMKQLASHLAPELSVSEQRSRIYNAMKRLESAGLAERSYHHEPGEAGYHYRWHYRLVIPPTDRTVG